MQMTDDMLLREKQLMRFLASTPSSELSLRRIRNEKFKKSSDLFDATV
jgi:hypothetical protein